MGLGVLLLALGAGALEANGVGFGAVLIGSGLAFVATAWGLRAGASWAPLLARVLGLVTASLAIVVAFVAALVPLGGDRGLRFDLPVVGATSGWGSLVLIGAVAVGGVLVMAAGRPVRRAT